jgi:hypothetical protein
VSGPAPGNKSWHLTVWTLPRRLQRAISQQSSLFLASRLCTEMRKSYLRPSTICWVSTFGSYRKT